MAHNSTSPRSPRNHHNYSPPRQFPSYPQAQQVQPSVLSSTSGEGGSKDPRERKYMWELDEDEQACAKILTNMLRDAAILNQAQTSNQHNHLSSSSTVTVLPCGPNTKWIDPRKTPAEYSRAERSHYSATATFTFSGSGADSSSETDTDTEAGSIATIVNGHRARSPIVYREPSVSPSSTGAVYLDPRASFGSYDGREPQSYVSGSQSQHSSQYESTSTAAEEEQGWYLNKWMEQDQRLSSESEGWRSRRGEEGVRRQPGLTPPGLLKSYAVYGGGGGSNTPTARRS